MAGSVTGLLAATTGSVRTNYARIGHAAQQVFPEILQNIIAIKKPPSRLHSDVSSNRFLSRNLRADEWSMVNNARTHGYTNFDIPLIYKLVSNLNLVPPPTHGWDYRVEPTPTEITPGDDIERIGRIRNKLLHRGNANVSDTELADYFVLFKDIARRLEQYLGKPRAEFVDPISVLESCSMDDKVEQMYLERLEKWRKKEEDLAKAVEYIREDVDSLINRDSNKIQIDKWQEENTHFIKTDVVDDIFETLEQAHVVSVTGNSGIGKSATVHHVALCLQNNQGYQVFKCFGPSDIFQHYKTGKLQVFVFDDVC